MKKGFGIRSNIRQLSYERNYRKIEKHLTADPHTLAEVTAYITETYEAKEIPRKSDDYRKMRGRIKESLILQHKPELLGKSSIEQPEDNNPESVKRFLLQMKHRLKKAEAVPNDVFPMDFHLYEIADADLYTVQICMENEWGELRVTSHYQDKYAKKAKQITKDIYRYYGVTEEDIAQRSKRYTSLVSELSH